MAVLDKFIEKAQSVAKKIVLPEGQDPRVVAAANQMMEMAIAQEVVVLGSEDEIAKSCSEAGISRRRFTVEDPSSSDRLESFAQSFRAIRAQRGKDVSMDKALAVMSNRLFFGNMLAREGVVDGMVAGSIASTGDMLRAAFTVIGTAPGIKTGSSSFIMDLKTPAPAGDKTLLFADCAVNPAPDGPMLADIAMATCKTHQALVGGQAKVAFLSFSSRGSADHAILDKVREAVGLFKDKVSAAADMDIVFDGELQADSAIVPKVAAKKCPDSPLKGEANILIFPDLNAGNICYKMTERLAGAAALGPVLQGLAKPVNDLSRGCSIDDIVGVAAITVCQAAV